MKNSILPLIALVLASVLSERACARDWDLTTAEATYVQLVGQGQVDKARELAQLGDINPNSLSGHPLAAYLVTGVFGNAFPARWSDATFDYVFEELKQDPNTLVQDAKRTVFAGFCNGMFGGNFAEAPALAERAFGRINTALALGARVSELKVAEAWLREAQPLPTCLRQLEDLPATWPESLRAIVHKVVDLYISKGADPNYEYRYRNDAPSVPLSAAMRRLDVPLLRILLAHKADIRHPIALSEKRGCPLRTPASAILEPDDRDAARAEPFLQAFVRAGGDISGKHFQCGTKSLKDLAVERGQTQYAKMVQMIEKGGLSSVPTTIKTTDAGNISGENAAIASRFKGDATDTVYTLLALRQLKPFVVTYKTVNPHNVAVEETRISFTPTLLEPCKLKMAYRRDVKSLLGTDAPKSYNDITTFDYRKMTAISARIEEDPEESILRAFGGPGKHPPRKVVMIHITGKGSVCTEGPAGAVRCNEDDEVGLTYHRAFGTNNPMDIHDAFARVKQACSGP